jgi:voltage-gated potassium channel
MTTTAAKPARPYGLARLRALMRELYNGDSKAAVRFRLAALFVDFAIIASFMLAPILRNAPGYVAFDYAVAVVLALELVGRALGYSSLKRWLRQPIVWLDIFVLLTLLVPASGYNLGYLRMIRLATLIHSDFFWDTIGRRYDDTRWEPVTKTLASLVAFLFITSGLVYTAFAHRAEGLNTYVDALYFTVTSVTTTGYGDILLPGHFGRLLSIVIMICGITLFVTLAQALVSPTQMHAPCPKCGQRRHAVDANHCRICGTGLDIPEPKRVKGRKR